MAGTHPNDNPLNDKQTRLLTEVVDSGMAKSPEDAIDKAHQPVHLQVDNLADLFARSPFRGMNMEFERDKDPGRDIEL